MTNRPEVALHAAASGDFRRGHDDLYVAVQSAFAPDGLLAHAIDAFAPRAGQTEMALAVTDAIASQGVLVVEAGTGIGKTFAYLVPALLSGQRVLLSTATKTLQDQLHGRDLPRLTQALGLPLRCALLKGRSSYLCLHRLEQARQNPNAGAAVSMQTLARVERWAQATKTGDLAELPGLDERSPVIPLVTSTRENCLGQDCPRYRDCHVNLARREALAADVVVINHHLFFADLAVRESGMAELLPSVNTVIFDEAHQLNETGVQFLGRQLSTAQALDFARDLLGAGLQQARGLADWQLLAGSVERAARDLRMSAGPVSRYAQSAGLRLSWNDAVPERVDAAAWDAAMQDLLSACEAARAALERVDELGPDFARLAERARTLADACVFFRAECAIDAVRWVDVSNQLRLVESPLDIAETVRTRLIGGANARAWIFTSATLGDDERLTWFTEPCGLLDAAVGARILRVGSPFDYARQAAVHVPRPFPKPNEAQHGEEVARLAARLASRLGGRTLVLTTTLRALRTVSERMAELLENENIRVYSQGQHAKRELLDRLRLGSMTGEPGCVLVASASFWEGVDIPGDALQLVVIDKLPFPPPTDPLVQARSRRLKAAGRSDFNDYHVPEAAVALKQGAGRLIRSIEDRGLLVICDPRLVQMGYGRRLMAALPPMRKLETEEEAAAWLLELRTAAD